MDSDIPSDAPRPRLCHLRKRPDFAEYGFNVRTEKGKSGHFIWKVNEGSPAYLAGLREGDRVIEVNGTHVESENLKQVVQRIKAVADEVKFLVLDRETNDYYRERKVVVRGDMHNVLVLETPVLHVGETNGTDLKHRVRLCHLKIWPEFAGYGFNMHAENGKIGQYIGKVDGNSPAELAGLKEHDRIVEVNGTSVSGESHKDVVKLIRSDPKQVMVLVVDREADVYFEKEGVAPSSHMHNVDRITCPDVQPYFDNDKHHNDVDKLEPLYKPRLCHIKERGDGKGLGFTLQAEKGKPGQFIGIVDPGSPAEAAGLRDGDRLVEVNAVNVENDSHKDVVMRIRSISNETTLLVIEKEGYEHYHDRGVVVTTDMVTSASPGSSSSSEHRSSAVTRDVCECEVRRIRYECDDCFINELCSWCKGNGFHREHSMEEIHEPNNPDVIDRENDPETPEIPPKTSVEMADELIGRIAVETVCSSVNDGLEAIQMASASSDSSTGESDTDDNASTTDDPFTARWSPAQSDVAFRREPVYCSEQEYKDVIANMIAADGQEWTNKVKEVCRIENYRIYKIYKSCKKEMERENGPGFQNERILWHGTRAEILSNIYRDGFNRSYCGMNATAFGDGVYFRTSFENSASRTNSPPDFKLQKHIFQCRVLTGHFTDGQEGLKKPPMRTDGLRYDSLVDNRTSPEIFVIFKDMQVYPEYVITLEL